MKPRISDPTRSRPGGWACGRIFLALAVLGGCLLSARGDVQIRLSVKVFLDANGNRPPATFVQNGQTTTNALATNAQIQEQVDVANVILRNARRGYTILLTEIVTVRNQSQWFNVDPRDGTGRGDLEKAAEGNKSGYGYRDDQINLYINNNNSSGSCALITGDIIFVGQGVRSTTIGHEVGHYFGLGHTQGYLCGGCSENPLPDIRGEQAPFNPCDGPQPDLIDDTLPDRECWTQDDIARFSFPSVSSYLALNPGGRGQVDAVFFNLMSYHDTRDRLTQDQMDRWVDFTQTQRSSVVSGRTTYVDRSNGCGLPSPLREWIDSGLVNPPFNPFQWGTRLSVGQTVTVPNPFTGRNVTFNFCLGGPYQTLREAVDRTSGGNVLAIRQGSYNETLTIRKAVTLSAMRGAVTLGR